MIYLDNTTQSQQVYIPRQIIQTATTREINNITSGDVINIVDEKLEPYYTSAETDTQIENAVAAESARCEETYAKIEDIPDVSNLVTSADVKTQVEDYHYITSGQAQEQINQSLSGYATEQWVEDKHYLTEHQSLSAYSTTEQIEGMIANESARTESTYAKINDIPTHYVNNVSNKGYGFQVEYSDGTYKPFYVSKINGKYILNANSGQIETNIILPTSADVKSQVEAYNYITSADLPDVSNFVTSADVKTQIEDYHYITSGDLPDVSEFITSGQAQEQINQSLSGYASEEYVDNAVNGAIDYVDDQFSSYSQEFTGYLAEKQDKTAMTAYYTSAETDTAIENAIAAEVERADSTYATPSDIPDVSEFITTGDLASYALSADVDTLVEDTIAAESARCEETYAKPDDVSSAVNELALGLAYLGVVNDVSESNGTVTITKTGLVSGEITTGLTDSFNLPDVSEFVTSADVETQITGKNYVTSAQVETQITGKGYALSGDLQTLSGNVAQNAEDIYAVDNALHTEYWNSARTVSELEYACSQLEDAIYIVVGEESGRTERTYAKIEDIPDVSNFVTSADVETQIDGNLSAYTPTSNFATINGSGITSGGNIVIQGGGGGGNANIIELTQAEYDALTAYTEDALYVITDAEEVDLNDFATSADLATKVDKINVTANSGNMRFPNWNAQGIITGYTYQAYQASFTLNGNRRTIYSTTNTAMPTIYAPTTAGNSGQVVVSNGIFGGAPSWSSFKFWYGSQNDYDAITTKDSTTIYFIID